MSSENDWFMRQIKGAANMIGSALHLQVQDLDLGQFEDEEGRQVNGARYFQELLESERFAEAIDFVQAQMKRLPLHQYDVLVDRLLAYLRQLDFEKREEYGFDENYLQHLEMQLKEFKW